MLPEPISITIRGGAGSGKTLLLRSLLDMMADAGFLTMEDTKAITENPGAFFDKVRPPKDNLAEEETVTIAIDKPPLLAHHLATLETTGGG